MTAALFLVFMLFMFGFGAGEGQPPLFDVRALSLSDGLQREMNLRNLVSQPHHWK